MSRVLLALTVIALCLSTHVRASDADQIIFSAPDELEAVTRFNASMLSDSLTFSVGALRQAMDREWWDLAANIIAQYLEPKKIDYFYEILKFRKEKLNLDNEKKFDGLMHWVQPEGKSQIQTVAPCFQWAQNNTYIFLRFKFSPRIDMPSPAKIFNVSVSWNSHEIEIGGLSFDSDAAIRWKFYTRTYLNIHLYYQNIWYWGSLNTIILELHKSPEIFWKNIVLNELETLPNQYFWWDLHMKMADQLGQNNYYLIDKELDIDKLEDQKSKLAARLKRDEQRRLKRLEKDKERQVNDLKARMQCWNIPNSKKCRVMNPFDWNSWVMLV